VHLLQRDGRGDLSTACLDIAAGTALDVSGYDESTGISLPDLAADNELVIEADCIYSHTGEGLHRFVDPTDDSVYLYSQFETADAKRMFACFDQPDLKATFDVRVTVASTRDVDGGVRTMLEELRVATFAQSVGAKGGASYGLYAGILINFPTWIFAHLIFEGFPYSLAWTWTLVGVVWCVIAGAVAGALYKK